MNSGRLMGQSVKRLEDRRLLSGGACFVDDVQLPDMAEMAVFRSPHAHARLLSLDLSAARAAPGALAVLSANELPDRLPDIPIRLAPREGFGNCLQKPLAVGKVRYVGEPVAIVVAETRYQAEDASSLIEAEWEVLPAVVDFDGAQRDQPLVFEPNGTNVAGSWNVGAGDVEKAFHQADYTRSERFRIRRQSPFPLETRGLVAVYDGEAAALRLIGATKVNYFNRRWLAEVLDLDESAVELVEVDVGGGFGARGEIYPEDYLVCVASRHVRMPVKWIEDRREHLIASNHAREMDCELEIAATKHGELLGLRASVRADLGAYVRTNGGVAISRVAQFLPGPYRIPAVACSAQALVTNKTPAGTYRGPGRFEANFFRERLIDMAAEDLGIDAAEIRLRNLLRPADLPWSPGPLVPGEEPAYFDAGDFPSVLRSVLREIDYGQWRDRQGQPAGDGLRHGMGFACFVESSAGGPPETARATIMADGIVEVRVGASSMGQGLKTVASQICAEILGIGMDCVKVLHGTTSLLPEGGGTFHSRNAVMAGNAVRLASEALRSRCLDLAALRWNTTRGALSFDQGIVHDAETGKSMNLIELVRYAPDRVSVDASFDNEGKTSFSYGAHAAHVAVDPETGEIRVLRYIVAEDIGRIVNPAMARGQAVGGAAQGIGGSLLDRFLFDTDGQPLATNLGEYLLPTSLDVGKIDTILTERHPSTVNPMGIKGAGEGGIVAAAGAVANAVAQALRGCKVRLGEIPLDPVSLCLATGAAERRDRIHDC